MQEVMLPSAVEEVGNLAYSFDNSLVIPDDEEDGGAVCVIPEGKCVHVFSFPSSNAYFI